MRGVYTGGDEKTLFFHHEYINELLPDSRKDQVSTFSILANSPEDVPRIAQAIDSKFINTDAPTKTESERDFAISFETMMGGVKQFMYGIMAAIAFSLLLVMGNTMAMTVRERTRRLACSALGFQRGTIARLAVGEALLITTRALIGIAGAMLLQNQSTLVFPNFRSFVPTVPTLMILSWSQSSLA